MDSLAIFLPIKGRSERVPQKNFQTIDRFRYGLLEIKLRQLRLLTEVSEVVVSSESQELLEASRIIWPEVKLVRRPEELSIEATPISELCKHAAEACNAEHVAWTHVTSPFFTPVDYRAAFSAYSNMITDGNGDSIYTVNSYREFLLFEDNPVNFSLTGPSAWGRTQDLQAFSTVNSALFLSRNQDLAKGNRVGTRPIPLVVERLSGFDIDNQFDLDFAKHWISENKVILGI